MSINTENKLWTCPKCKQKFVTKNLSHSCTQFTADEFFNGKPTELKRLYKKLQSFVRQSGPILVNINKTRISFQTKIRFSGVSRVLKDALLMSLVLDREINSPRIFRIEFYPPAYYVHYVKIKSEADLDKELFKWIQDAYKIGMREHLIKKRS